MHLTAARLALRHDNLVAQSFEHSDDGFADVREEGVDQAGGHHRDPHRFSLYAALRQ